MIGASKAADPNPDEEFFDSRDICEICEFPFNHPTKIGNPKMKCRKCSKTVHIPCYLKSGCTCTFVHGCNYFVMMSDYNQTNHTHNQSCCTSELSPPIPSRVHAITRTARVVKALAGYCPPYDIFLLLRSSSFLRLP